MLSQRVLARTLGVDAKSVRVERVDLVDDELEIRLRPRVQHRWRCPHCRARRPGYDQRTERRWRALDFRRIRVHVIAQVPRVRCVKHGVVVAAVPWARHDARHTLAFEQLAAWCAVALLRWVIASGWGEAVLMKRRRACPVIQTGSVLFAGFRFPPEVILLAVRWYLRFGLSYRDLEELLAERGVDVDHVTLFRWVQRFTPALVDAARPCRHAVGDRWFVDETYVKVAGRWHYVYRAVDQYGQVIDVYLSDKRDTVAATRFFTAAIGSHGEPVEVTTDRAHALAKVIEDLLPGAVHDTRQYANNRVEADHGRLKARLRPMRGLKRVRTASVIIAGHAFMQNLRRGHHELGVLAAPGLTVAAAFDELARAV